MNCIDKIRITERYSVEMPTKNTRKKNKDSNSNSRIPPETSPPNPSLAEPPEVGDFHPSGLARI